MTTQPDIDQLIRKTRRYEFSDGLRDLQLAVLIVLCCLPIWLTFEPGWITFVANMVARYGRRVVWLNFLLVFLAPLVAFGLLGVMKYVRRRWLWRQSGMVASLRWVVSKRVSLISSLIFILGIGVAVSLRYQGWVEEIFILRMLFAATGWSFGYTLAGVGREVGLARYVRIGWIGGLASTVILFVNFTFGQSALLLGCLWGALFAASGLLVLRRALASPQQVEVKDVG